MARTGKLSPEARDDHYREFDRLLGLPSTSGPRRFKPACPPPSQITVPEEIFWLTVMLAQMRWPLPEDIRYALADLPRSSRFSIEQVRYLLRHDLELTALHAAKAGALIAGWPADLATKALLEMARQRQSPAADELTGRWPLPTAPERRQWEEDKNTFFRERHRHLTRDEKVAWLCLAYGQMGWPLPSLLTRLFPVDWTRRKMDSALLANIFNAIGVADAAIADAQVKGLDRAGILSAANSWASFERSREAEAKAGGIPAFVMFRDKLPRAGPQGRLYRQLFDQAQTVLQGEGQQPEERLQLLDFLNRQTAVDGELARRKPATNAAGDLGSHVGIRVSPPAAPRTVPTPTHARPSVEAGVGMVSESDTGDEEKCDDDREADDDELDVEDVDEGSATDGRTHEAPGDVPVTSPPQDDEQVRSETIEDARADQLTRSIDQARQTTDDAGGALPGDPLSVQPLEAAEPLVRGAGAMGSTDRPATTMAAVEASADPEAGEDGSLSDEALRIKGDGTADDHRSASVADATGEAERAASQEPPAKDRERAADDGTSAAELPPSPSENLGDQTDQSAAERTEDDDWAYLNDPANSFRSRWRRSTSAALRDARHGQLEVDGSAATEGPVEDINSSQSPPDERPIQPTEPAPAADVVVGDTGEVSGDVDHLGGFWANEALAGNEFVVQPAAWAPVGTKETVGRADKAVASQDAILPAPSQAAEAQASSAGETNDKNDGDEKLASTPVASLPSDIGDAKRSEAQRLKVPGEEKPRHEAAHPFSVHRSYRHDVAQPKGSDEPQGYEVERISVRLDDRGDPA
jgi:hypothetical protein